MLKITQILCADTAFPEVFYLRYHKTFEKKLCLCTGGASSVAALPQEEVGAAAEAEEGEEEEEEAAGW